MELNTNRPVIKKAIEIYGKEVVPIICENAKMYGLGTVENAMLKIFLKKRPVSELRKEATKLALK